jgi:cytochrome c oxidase subunit II
MLVFIYKYNRKRNPKATQIEGNTTLEAVWVVVPLLITF